MEFKIETIEAYKDTPYQQTMDRVSILCESCKRAAHYILLPNGMAKDIDWSGLISDSFIPICTRCSIVRTANRQNN